MSPWRVQCQNKTEHNHFKVSLVIATINRHLVTIQSRLLLILTFVSSLIGNYPMIGKAC